MRLLFDIRKSVVACAILLAVAGISPGQESNPRDAADSLPKGATARHSLKGDHSEEPVRGLAVSPDGKQLVGVGRGGQIWASTGSNAEWVPAGVTHGSAQALATTNDGAILVFDDSGLTAIDN